MLRLDYIDTLRYEAGRPKALFLLIDLEKIENLKVAVWGNGLEAYMTCNYLCKIGIHVECFINSDVRMVRKRFCDRRIVTPDQICREEYFIIVAMTQPRYSNEVLWYLKVRDYKHFGLSFIETYHAFVGNERNAILQRLVLDEINKILCGEKDIYDVIKPVVNVGPAGNFLGDIPEFCWTTTWSDCLLEWFYEKYMGDEKKYTMLEIGPGKGLFSAVAHQINSNIEIQWLMFDMDEACEEAVEGRYAYYPANQFKSYYGMIENPEYCINSKFDIIVMTEVLEHFVKNPISGMRKIASLLDKNGKLYLSTPSGRHLHIYEDYNEIPDYHTLEDYKDKYVGHTYEYSKFELEDILKKCDLVIEKYDLSDSGNHNLIVKKFG